MTSTVLDCLVRAGAIPDDNRFEVGRIEAVALDCEPDKSASRLKSSPRIQPCETPTRPHNFLMHPCLTPLEDDAGEIVAYSFWCPGCATIDRRHGLHVFTSKTRTETQNRNGASTGSIL